MLKSKRMISLVLLYGIILIVACSCLFVAPKLSPEKQKEYDKFQAKKQANPKVTLIVKGVAVITSYYDFRYDGQNFYEDVFPDLKHEVFRKMLEQTNQYNAKWVESLADAYTQYCDQYGLLLEDGRHNFLYFDVKGVTTFTIATAHNTGSENNIYFISLRPRTEGFSALLDGRSEVHIGYWFDIEGNLTKAKKGLGCAAP